MREILETQRAAFMAALPEPLAVRKDRLTRAIAMVTDHAERFCDSLSEDFGHRSREQSMMTDIAGSISPLKHARTLGLRRAPRAPLSTRTAVRPPLDAAHASRRSSPTMQNSLRAPSCARSAAMMLRARSLALPSPLSKRLRARSAAALSCAALAPGAERRIARAPSVRAVVGLVGMRRRSACSPEVTSAGEPTSRVG